MGKIYLLIKLTALNTFILFSIAKNSCPDCLYFYSIRTHKACFAASSTATAKHIFIHENQYFAPS